MGEHSTLAVEGSADVNGEMHMEVQQRTGVKKGRSRRGGRGKGNNPNNPMNKPLPDVTNLTSLTGGSRNAAKVQ